MRITLIISLIIIHVNKSGLQITVDGDRVRESPVRTRETFLKNKALVVQSPGFRAPTGIF